MADKELLLKAICGYLPYALQVRNPRIGGPDYVTGIDTETWKLQVLYNGYTDDIEKFKPYLRPMSSMTDDEVTELAYKVFQQPDIDIIRKWVFENKLYPSIDGNPVMVIDWLNARHFDYRGLIEKNLALDCTGLHIYD